MPSNQDTLLRQWQMLRFIPRHPRKIAVQEIQRQLLVEGFKVSDRTVQRDLHELSEIFPLTVDDREKPFGWSWQKEAKAFDLPGLSVAEALTWAMAEQYLGQLLPGSMLDHLVPHFRAAHERLNKEGQPQHGRSWLNKIRTVEPMQPLIPPAIDPEVQRVVSDALLQERQIEIAYQGKGKSESSIYQVHPLALVQRGHVLYLYGRLFDYQNTRILAMHRIESARLLDEAAVPPTDFDLDDKIAKGVWSFGAGDKLQITCRFFDGTGEHLLESPLSKDQQVSSVSDDMKSMIITASVIDTPQLRWWLLGFGDGIEVLAPASLRQEMSDIAHRLRSRYSTTNQEN